MKKTRSFLFLGWTLALALAVLSAIPSAYAADIRGKLTLPMEAHWNGTTLPAGNYEYSLQYNGASTVVMVRNTDTMAGSFFMARSVSAAPTAKSGLILTREGDSMSVTTLNVGDMSLAFGAFPTKVVARTEATTASAK
jgi:hypothetical protein